MSNEVVIVAAGRSAMGRGGKGALKDTRPDDLLAQVMKGTLARVPAVKPEMIEDLVIGCAFPEGEQGMNVARLAVFVAKWPESIPAVTVNRFCSSGLQAVAQAAEHIAFGSIDVAMAGGVESMSMVPMTGNKFSANPDLVDTYPQAYIPMGHTAERVANKFEITREAQDQFALRSHQRAVAAQKDGQFKEQIIPVTATKYGPHGHESVTFEVDEMPRADSSLETLAKLKPAFIEGGSVTAGNASPLTDGAAAVVLMSKQKADELGLKPMMYFRGFAVAGVPPEIMGIGPIKAIPKVLAQAGVKADDLDWIELNEAFAAQALAVIKDLGLDAQKVNPQGGAIALGHPLGATGAIRTATLLHGMRRNKQKWGMVSMCIGTGMGAAGLFEAL